jgi:hypothetical protein
LFGQSAFTERQSMSMTIRFVAAVARVGVGGAFLAVTIHTVCDPSASRFTLTLERPGTVTSLSCEVLGPMERCNVSGHTLLISRVGAGCAAALALALGVGAVPDPLAVVAVVAGWVASVPPGPGPRGPVAVFCAGFVLSDVVGAGVTGGGYGLEVSRALEDEQLGSAAAKSARVTRARHLGMARRIP